MPPPRHPSRHTLSLTLALPVQDLLSKIASGKPEGALEQWQASFEEKSIQAASSCTAMGAFVLQNHVFSPKPQVESV